MPDAIRAAKQAGFDAVECHWPYETPAKDVEAALDETGLSMLGLNTRRGNVAGGENGLAAVVGRENEAQGYIDEALAYAEEIECANVHVMAGCSKRDDAAEACFRANLAYACDSAAESNRIILIEPLNSRDAPGYHLATLEAALITLDAVNRPNLKIMFDCYHLQIMGGDLLKRLSANMDHIGHIQIAAVPDRGEPNHGEIDFPWLLAEIDHLGWSGFIGAEYRPRGSTDAGLAWLSAYK